ncbi:MAG: calcineurin-like phosphoesterase family protein [Pseudomonadota bacterium]
MKTTAHPTPWAPRTIADNRILRDGIGSAAILSALLLTLVPVADAAPLEATGTVYDDRNGNGVQDESEEGIAGVAVSNGRDVVLTDDQGRYTVPVDASADVIFITKPSGYAPPVNGYQIPQFYYLHRPQGSPDGLRYPGVSPTGPLPESIDFPLRAVAEPDRYSAILFADTQPQTQAELDYVRDDVIADLIGTDARFGMTLGDLLFDDLSMFPRYLSIVAQLGIPWHNVPGNHELNLLAESDAESLETFQRYFGPPYYSFDYGQVHYVVLDNIEYRGNGEADPGDYRGSGGYVARFTEQQLDWLEKDLALVPADRMVVLAMHSPLKTYSSDRVTSNTANRKALFERLAGRQHLYAIAGHTHTNEHHYFGEEDGFAGPGTFHHHVLGTVSGSWWSGPFDERGIAVAEQQDGTPNGYHLLDVDGNALSVRFRAAGKPADYQMRILIDADHYQYEAIARRDVRMGALLDGSLSVDQVPAARILVNLFDGGPKSTVSFAIGNGPTLPMTRVQEMDPHTRELYDRFEAQKKPWVDAIPSSHLWAADLPDSLGAGTYTVTVKAVDEFGRTHHGHRILEVQGSSALTP